MSTFIFCQMFDYVVQLQMPFWPDV